MALSVEEMEALLRMAIRATACLPDLPAAARIEAEAAIDAEARRAIAGLPNRLGDPTFLDAFGWTEEPAAEDVAEQLRFSIGGHFEAYDDAIRRGESVNRHRNGTPYRRRKGTSRDGEDTRLAPELPVVSDDNRIWPGNVASPVR